MSLSAELQLFMLAVGLYVFDSMLLLFPNEGILTPVGKSRWHVAFGSDNTRMGGKEVLFPNLFLLHRPIFRLSWDCEGVAQQDQPTSFDWNKHREIFRGLIFPVYCIGIAQFLVFPYVIFFFLTDLSIVLFLAYLYGSIFIALFLVYRKREGFHLSKKKFLSLGFECVVCPPVAVNLIRKISVGIPDLVQDLLVVSQTLLEGEDWNRTRDQFISRLSEAIDFEDENTPRFKNLITNRDRLLNEATL